MKLAVLAMAAATAAPNAGATGAAEPAKLLELRPKAAIMTAAPGKLAPFSAGLGDQPGTDLDLLPKRDVRQEQSRSSCSGDRVLCYDPNSGRIVYRPARQFMPAIPGMTPENISVKRDRIVFRYSF